jgi:hypothetical protein
MLVAVSTGNTRRQGMLKSLCERLESICTEGIRVVEIDKSTQGDIPLLSINTRVLLMCVDCADIFSDAFISDWYARLCERVDISSVIKILFFVDAHLASTVSEQQQHYGDTIDYVLSARYDKIKDEAIPTLIKILQH